MPTQTRTWQRRILDAARADDYHDLYWYIEATAPGRIVFPAAYPGRYIPVVPVGLDPETSRHYACAWYIWGSLDVICPTCAAVGWESCCCVPVRRVT